jgi:ubiquinone/menaquinone biosynthesis C-methylase UbiE
MRNLGKFLCDKKPDIKYYENLFDSLLFKETNKFDIVYCSFVLEEIKSADERLMIIN